jgi:hypothetical protein
MLLEERISGGERLLFVMPEVMVNIAGYTMRLQ